ncbi:MAG: high frequency lysogenization protein HflD [Gammaproteobacteria bacterium]|nr:high frequency lysogenization protein HflD [Gammaproteobacteria bacterium]
MGIEDNTLALAGIFQAIQQVKQIAREGRTDDEAFSVSINSLFKIDADSTEDVYGGPEGLVVGLRTLGWQLGYAAKKRDSELLRYGIGIILLESRLRKHPKMLEAIHIGIERATRQAEVSSCMDPNVIALFADIYSQTLSTFSYRIHVHGEPRFLENQENTNRIRALLLAGVRSAVLWRQTGGGRLQLLFSRKKILRSAERRLSIVNG